MAKHISYAVGVDIGGTHTKLGLVNRNGEIIEFRCIPSATSGNPQPFLDNLIQNISELYEQGGSGVIGIGLSLHGFIDPDRTRSIICPNTPALAGVNLYQLVKNKLELPVIVNNDLTAHALAEYHFGTGRGISRFLCLALGTGVGAGVIVNGEALRFVGGCAGDNGHIILQPDGPSCSMGCRGCAEALCGVVGIEHLTKERTGKEIPANEVISGACRGEPEMIFIIEQIGEWIGLACASLYPVFLPERIALTGGTSEAGSVLLEACEKSFRKQAEGYHQATMTMASDYYKKVDFVIGKMRGQTGVVGAVVELLRSK